jgi:SAM-dependent methyltransferase
LGRADKSLRSAPVAEGERIARRFDFECNRAAEVNSGSERYDAANYRMRDLALGAIDPEFVTGNFADTLLALIEATQARWRDAAHRRGAPLSPPDAVSAAVRQVAECLTRPRDRDRALLHAAALESGYSQQVLAALAGEDAIVTVIAGDLESWFGKTRERLPTAFAAVRHDVLDRPVRRALRLEEAMRDWLRSLHFGLRMAPLPDFAPTDLAMMAGEGDTHPKHIAYFLPSDLGVSRSPYKRSYYFANVHMALIDAAGLPLAREHLDLGRPWPDVQSPEIATLGVLAHEAGHAVFRDGNPLVALNRADRWLSVTMQEVMADVFGTLLFAEVIGPALGHDREEILAYHLAECLRYVDRGLGCFPDSDGMYLQLSYLASFGVLAPSWAGGALLKVDVQGVLAGLRSLGRVLADIVLAGDVGSTRELARSFGPASRNPVLEPLLMARSSELPISLRYKQAAPTRLAPLLASPKRLDGASNSGGEIDDGLFRFYCAPRLDENRGDLRTLYQIWEDQQACNDSVTPSTYCDAYREHLVDCIADRIPPAGRIFSIGCGNAFVERDLVSRGYRVDGIDWNREAVDLALAKGVGAMTGDFLQMPPSSLAEYDAVYADGLLGHLYDDGSGLAAFFAQLRRTEPQPGSWLIFSNDAPLDPAQTAQPHPRVDNFWLISRTLLTEVLQQEGYEVVEDYYYRYERPVSGERDRTICIARVRG